MYVRKEKKRMKSEVLITEYLCRKNATTLMIHLVMCIIIYLTPVQMRADSRIPTLCKYT